MSTYLTLPPEKGIAAPRTETEPEIIDLLKAKGWVESTPPEPEPPGVPQSVTPRQFSLALHAAGLLATVEEAIASAGTEARIEWERSTSVLRSNQPISPQSFPLRPSAICPPSPSAKGSSTSPAKTSAKPNPRETGAQP